MRVWIDIANSPHVGLFDPVVKHMRGQGWTVLLTARDHAQTAELAVQRWPEVVFVGGESPAGRISKGTSVIGRAARLFSAARRFRPSVALSHGSYAQLMAAKALRIGSVTMMDYEYQPANHVSFRLADRVLVPEVFPRAELTRCGARDSKVRRYHGFKEELYLGECRASTDVLDSLGNGADDSRIVVVLRPPPSGALYHRQDNERFDSVAEILASRTDVHAILLPRNPSQRARYSAVPGLTVPGQAVEGLPLLAQADLVIGAGGTMNREAALLGTPTYTLFAGRLAAVDAELVRQGLMHDLRANGALPPLEKRSRVERRSPKETGRAILELIMRNVEEVSESSRGHDRRSRRP